jgi:hypothetical protein
VNNPLATIIIPFANYHNQLVHRAIASAKAQTFPVDIISAPSFPGPAKLRNAPLNPELNICTPFVVFLDADDVLAPTFVEECIRAYETGKYVYTRWREGSQIRSAKPCPFLNGSAHIVTTLYPTECFKALGGFDESLPGNEDIDFYLRSIAHGICGIHLEKVLVDRPEDSGRRSKEYIERPDYLQIKDDVIRRNGGIVTLMGCCGQPGAPAPQNPGEKQPGDVLAQTLWMGMRSENGRSTGRMYIGGNGNMLYMSPDDIKAAPELFRQVVDKSRLAPDSLTLLKESGII